MKTKLVLFCFLFAPLFLPLWAQYSIDWSTIDGGGGTSTGGPMTNGQYSVTGGFWTFPVAVQTPGAPMLTITINAQPSTINVSWPSSSTGWIMQQNTNSVSSVNLSHVTSVIVDDGTTKTLIVNPSTGSRCYRLYQP